MKDIDIKKEGNLTEFDYSNMWEEKDSTEIKKQIEKLPKGMPRKGIKGKYIKPLGHVSRKRINYSYARGIKKLKEEENKNI